MSVAIVLTIRTVAARPRARSLCPTSALFPRIEAGCARVSTGVASTGMLEQLRAKWHSWRESSRQYRLERAMYKAGQQGDARHGAFEGTIDTGPASGGGHGGGGHGGGGHGGGGHGGGG